MPGERPRSRRPRRAGRGSSLRGRGIRPRPLPARLPLRAGPGGVGPRDGPRDATRRAGGRLRLGHRRRDVDAPGVLAVRSRGRHLRPRRSGALRRPEGQLATLWREAGLHDVTDGSLTIESRYRDSTSSGLVPGGVGPPALMPPRSRAKPARRSGRRFGATSARPTESSRLLRAPGTRPAPSSGAAHQPDHPRRPDLGRARAFYEALGWKPTPRPTTTSSSSRPAAWSSPSGVETSWPRTPASRTPAAGAGSRSPTTRARPRRSTRCWPRPRRRRDDPARRRRDVLGRLLGVFVDPDGHAWEVAHNPHWTLAEDGSVTL